MDTDIDSDRLRSAGAVNAAHVGWALDGLAGVSPERGADQVTARTGPTSAIPQPAVRPDAQLLPGEVTASLDAAGAPAPDTVGEPGPRDIRIMPDSSTFASAPMAPPSAAPIIGAPPPAGATPTPAAMAMPAAAMPTPVPMQPDALAGQVAWQLRDGIAQATVRLDPEGLGHLEIAVETEGDQARLIFAARRAETVDLLHQHLPRLQAALAESGFSGLDVDIRRDSGSDGQHRPSHQAPDAERRRGDTPVSASLTPAQSGVALGDGRLDAWA